MGDGCRRNPRNDYSLLRDGRMHLFYSGGHNSLREANPACWLRPIHEARFGRA